MIVFAMIKSGKGLKLIQYDTDMVVKRIICVFAGVILAILSLYAEETETQRPNIVYIMLDEWGYYEMSSLGHPLLETPVIDRLAGEGMRFARMLAGGNVCAPTRATLMLGQHTGHTTVRANSGTAPIRDDDVTLAEVRRCLR